MIEKKRAVEKDGHIKSKMRNGCLRPACSSTERKMCAREDGHVALQRQREAL